MPTDSRVVAAPAAFEAGTRLHVSTPAREPTRHGVIGHRITTRRDMRFHLGLPVSSWRATDGS